MNPTCNSTTPPNGKITMDLSKIYQGEEEQHMKIHVWKNKFPFMDFF